MSSFEKLVGQALLGNDTDKDTAMRRVTCKLAASTKMFCQCGNMLDQRTVHVLEAIDDKTKTEKTLGAVCPSCAAALKPDVERLANAELGVTSFRWQTWNESIQIG